MMVSRVFRRLRFMFKCLIHVQTTIRLLLILPALYEPPLIAYVLQ